MIQDPRSFILACASAASAINLLLVAHGRREGFLLGTLAHAFWGLFNVLDGRAPLGGLSCLFASLYLYGYLRRLRRKGSA